MFYAEKNDVVKGGLNCKREGVVGGEDTHKKYDPLKDKPLS